jgi:hypothetical protein
MTPPEIVQDLPDLDEEDVRQDMLSRLPNG